jgi:hypothetical protein
MSFGQRIDAGGGGFPPKFVRNGASAVAPAPSPKPAAAVQSAPQAPHVVITEQPVGEVAPVAAGSNE